MNKPILHVYFDMDGVLAHFNELHTVTKPFLAPGSHYFLYPEPDTKAVDLMRALDEFPNVRTHVLTRLLPGLDESLMDEHERDKLAWCRNLRLTRDFAHGKEAPFICLRGTMDKSSALEDVPDRYGRAWRVLVDDDPAILKAWEDAGGTGFQYVQYKRTYPDRHSRILTYGDSVPDMAARILRSPLEYGHPDEKRR